MFIMGNSRQLIRAALFVCTGCILSGTADAGETDWHLSGFGTLAGVKTDEDTAKYRLDLRQGDGATSDVDWGLLSKAGAQLSVDFGRQFSITAQAVAQRRGQDDMNPEIEWLYASYRPVSWFDIRVGRLVMPELMMSDYRSVGYAQPTLTAPAIVYLWGSVSQFEGAQILNRIPLAGGLLTLQASTGEAKDDFWINTEPTAIAPGVIAPPYMEARFENMRALNATYEWGNWLLRTVRVEGDTIFPIISVRTEQSFTGFGLQYDNGHLLVMAESIDRSDSASAEYVMFGWQFGKWLPSATFSHSKVVEQVTLQNINYNSKMFALRYNISKNLAAKLQWEEVPADFINGFNQWLDAYPGFSGDRKVISLGLDFVF